MYKYIIPLLFLNFWFSGTNSQNNKWNKFILKGRINVDSGTIMLVPIGDESYYPGHDGFHETQVYKGKFIFNGNISYPYAYRVRLNVANQLKYMSDLFVVQPGVQDIICNVDSIWKIPTLHNKYMTELATNYLAGGASKEQQNKNFFLYSYIKNNANSYIGLWKLVDLLSEGYNPVQDSIFGLFSVPVKKTYTGKYLNQKLENAKATAIGNLFPEMELEDSEGKSPAIASIYQKNKFTLVDFWFSHCTPCIGQFPQLKTAFEKFHTKGFTIIGISTDSREKIPDWKNIIEKNKLPWLQFLDIGGMTSNKLSILRFPTNFLLDHDGKIIKKDIDPSALINYLSEKLQLSLSEK